MAIHQIHFQSESNQAFFLREANSEYKEFLATCSSIEDELTFHAAIPILGFPFALLKMAFGLLQLAASLLISSILLLACFSERGRSSLVFASSHIIHGMCNIMSGALLTLPIISTLLATPVCGHFLAPGRLGSKTYLNDQTHKYVGYKTLTEDSWRLETVLDEETRHSEQEIPKGAPRADALFGYW